MNYESKSKSLKYLKKRFNELFHAKISFVESQMINNKKNYLIHNEKFNKISSKNYICSKNNISLKILNNIFLVYIIINIFFQTNIKCEESFITLKINKPGLHKILFHTPISMEINNESIDPPVFEYNFTERENTIKLFFEDLKTDYKCLFCECSDIDEIDASHLITSKVIFFNFTFFKCNSLTSLNISNFNTEKVISMRGIFRGCSSLTSIDVSNFITTSLYNIS